MDPNKNFNTPPRGSWPNNPSGANNLDPQQLMQMGINPFVQLNFSPHQGFTQNPSPGGFPNYSPHHGFTQNPSPGGFPNFSPHHGFTQNMSPGGFPNYSPHQGFTQNPSPRGEYTALLHGHGRDNYEDDEVIPETQVVLEDDDNEDKDEEDVAEIPAAQAKGKGKYGNRNPRLMWTQEDERFLAQAVIAISNDPIIGTDQPGDAFFKRVTAEYNRYPEAQRREKHAITTKWRSLKARVSKFQGVYDGVKRQKRSGWNEEKYVEEALKQYRERTGLTFTHISAWRVLKEQPRWCAPTGMAEGSRPSKRSKTSSASNPASNPNTPGSGSDAHSYFHQVDDEDDEEEPQEIPRPIGRDHAKRDARTSGTASGSTQRSTESLEDRVSKMMTTSETLSEQMQQAIAETQELNAFRFYNMPINPALDPTAQEAMKKKKLAIREKYGF